MKIYENVIIGNFLFGLGFAIRARQQSAVIPSVVNLLQQTPADKVLGDVLLDFPGAGVVRLIEFKAQGNYSDKEKIRHKLLTEALKDKPELQAISRRLHWFILTSVSSKEVLKARIVSYLDAFPSQRKKEESLTEFIDNLAEEVVHASQNDEERQRVKEYLMLVRMTQGDGKVGSGGLLLMAKKDGSVDYAPFADLAEMRMEHRQWLDYQNKMEQQLEKQREKTLELEYKGPSRGREL